MKREKEREREGEGGREGGIGRGRGRERKETETDTKTKRERDGERDSLLSPTQRCISELLSPAIVCNHDNKKPRPLVRFPTHPSHGYCSEGPDQVTLDTCRRLKYNTDSPEGTPGYLVWWWVGPTLSYRVTHHPQIRLTELIPSE